MIKYDIDALEYISKLSDGGLRDAITLMDKCLSYSKSLTLSNVVEALGVEDYNTFKDLIDCIIAGKKDEVISIVEKVHYSGKDLKQFNRDLLEFLLDINKYVICNSFDYLQIPATEDNKEWMDSLEDYDKGICYELLKSIMKLNIDIKYSQTPKYDIEATLILFMQSEV